MNKRVILILAIVVLPASFLLGRWSAEPQPPAQVERPFSAPVERYEVVVEPTAFSAAEASDLRASNYIELNDMKGVLDLPSDFAQTEALYAVAGRADRSEVERLIGQAVDIANRYDRVAALSILFGRYGEIDPVAAVDYLVAMRLDVDEQMFNSIFDAWAKSDLNAAVAKANELTNSRQRKQAAYAILNATSRFQEGLLEQVAADLRGNFDLARYRSEAVGIRASSNPQLALQEALSMTDRHSRWGAISRVATVWARNDPVQAISALDQISDQQVRSQYAGYVLNRWIADDPDQAMQFLSAYPPGPMREQLLTEGLAQLSAQRPQEAMSLAQQLSGPNQMMAMSRIAQQWASDDPESALIGVMALENTSQREQMLASIGQNLAMRSPDKAFQWIEQMGADPASDQVVGVLMTVAQANPRRALEHVMTHFTGDARSSTLISVLRAASRNDPSLVLDYVSQLPNSTEANDLFQNVAGSLARQDPDSALQWISSLTGTAKFSAIQGAVYSLSTTDPARASRLIAQLPPDRTGQMIQNVSASMVHRDPEGAIAWLQQYQGQSGYDDALSQVIRGVARSDPQRALQLSAGLDGSQRVETTEVAVSRWAQKAPLEAARWASRADASIQVAALGSVADAWGRSDPVRATSWAMSLPSGPGRDRALVTLSYHASSSLDRAVDIITRISTESDRGTAIRMAYQRLLSESGSSSAARLLDEVGASDELRQRVQQSIGR